MVLQAKTVDFKDIAKIYTDNWKSTYKHLLPSTLLEKITYEDTQIKWGEYCKNTHHGILIYKDEAQKVCGFVAYKPCVMHENALLIDSLHVSKAAQGKGIGKSLICAVGSYALEHGYKKMTICVVQGNEKAQAVYEHLGAVFLKYFEDNFYGITINATILVWKNLP